MHFSIGNMKLSFFSNTAFTTGDKWEQFRISKPSRTDFTYECHLTNVLPVIETSPAVRHYYDNMSGRCYAITVELEDRMVIYLSEENLPWGTELQQIYTQLALPHVLLHKNKLLLHSSYILTQEGAILFTAPSGTGKSTQAELWKQYRSAYIVNGDRAVVGIEAGIPTAYGFPFSGSSLDCQNHSAKLRAIVSLKQAPQNSVKRLNISQGVQVLVNGTYLPREYREDLSRSIDTAMLIAQSTPIFELACLPDESAVIALEQALA